MSNPYRDCLAELHTAIQLYTGQNPAAANVPPAEMVRRLMDAMAASAAALDQPEHEVPKPVVDYSRVPEIATEAQIRSAAQYLVKKRNCDGDLIPAIEYAIARWGCPTPQPVALSERPWEREGWCDEQGECWLETVTLFPDHPAWIKTWPALVEKFPQCYVRSLPAHALPTPEATVHD